MPHLRIDRAARRGRKVARRKNIFLDLDRPIGFVLKALRFAVHFRAAPSRIWRELSAARASCLGGARWKLNRSSTRRNAMREAAHRGARKRTTLADCLNPTSPLRQRKTGLNAK